MKGRTVFVYRDSTCGSDVQITETTIDGLAVRAKGIINTFTENGTNAKCNFSLNWEYNDDFTKYRVISEIYGAPELILPKLD